MSNHNGSYMLNHVLKLMDEYHLFEHLGREQTQQFVFRFAGTPAWLAQ
jgi:hypothetical protein